ncbi:hypothetical protein WR164_05220 [Philodulcilactobacillus myokoensis]|uniref:Uncharacterized protein n=1 Tax=Philodulcilactobacillus myokoensis TaxID=2929573 RepID=A0A9W6B193_9LACO|nr:hypothetical protein [Philodulcilactobacillus myokoensis]GLB46543.1 hypothetical protein WR164_05220 [Philodulcilactobacillus myokoensis]
MKANFSSLHPFFTNHYKLDWINQFQIKDVLRFLRTIFPTVTPDGVANYINQSMKSIMQNQKLIFGIGDKKTDHFLGMIRIDFKNHQATMNIDCVEKLADSEALIEIVQRMVTLLFSDQIKVDKIKIINNADNESLYHWLDDQYKITITSVTTRMIYIINRNDKK